MDQASRLSSLPQLGTVSVCVKFSLPKPIQEGILCAKSSSEAQTEVYFPLPPNTAPELVHFLLVLIWPMILFLPLNPGLKINLPLHTMRGTWACTDSLSNLAPVLQRHLRVVIQTQCRLHP